MKSRMNTFDEQFLSAFESDKQQILKIKEQNKVLNTLNEKVIVKDQEIESLKAKLRKYQRHHDEGEKIKATLAVKEQDLLRKEKENQILVQEVSGLLKENQEMREQLLNAEKLKHEFVKERNLTDVTTLICRRGTGTSRKPSGSIERSARAGNEH